MRELCFKQMRAYMHCTFYASKIYCVPKANELPITFNGGPAVTVHQSSLQNRRFAKPCTELYTFWLVPSVEH